MHMILSLLAAVSMGTLLGGCASEPQRADYPRRLATANGASEEYDFFYASTRELDGDYWGARKEFASELEKGSYRTRIAAELHIGEHSNAEAWQENQELELLSVESLTDEAWWQALQEAVERSPHDSLLVLVWGWKEPFESAAVSQVFLATIRGDDHQVEFEAAPVAERYASRTSSSVS